MSGVMKRMKLVVEAKANAAMERRENPVEMLDLSYEKQLELLQKVRRGVAEVATSRKRLEIQLKNLQADYDKRGEQAKRALEVGREDLAREALVRRAPVQQQIEDMTLQYNALQGEEEKLVRASQSLQQKVDAFRTKKETIKATYAAAQATTQIGEAFSGLSEEMGDVNMAIERAENKTAQLQARGAALDELTASGVLNDPTGYGKDDITRELEALSAGSGVENEMSRLRNEIAAGDSKKQIGPGAGA
ncbi:phage shock protein A, PspA [Catenulispora acidiphila DSM 44928]|uniref:Phage shock protein A, PspA n=1 Tax=Catenulispora acidiphila (strain DSM 44928 / JCM 14897 / NBRC 102108 / NRRL B-24433 / ID139908) TaxID=479433 RepID=C7Q8U3_CATAD|nr:PspA/IM30 family protein [Catenulispora acidiphila]ACU70358.1 phage shock protein A, PspA [Catenulispora acidiphila DSM 44928]